MRTTEIRLKVELDNDNIPEKLYWQADDGASYGLEETKAFALSIWDPVRNETLRIDLWSKDMDVRDMKRLMLDSLAGMARTLERATGDTFMVEEMDALGERLAKHLRDEHKQMK